MSRNTKFVGVIYVMIAIVAALTFAAEPEKVNIPKRQDKAKQIASAWFNSLMRGDTAVTTALSDVPFAWDRKQTIESIGTLEEMLESIVKEKGKREIKTTGINVDTHQNEILKEAFPADYLIVHLMVDDEGVALCVRPGDTFKVVGFSD